MSNTSIYLILADTVPQALPQHSFTSQIMSDEHCFFKIAFLLYSSALARIKMKQNYVCV